jgi:serralysin
MTNLGNGTPFLTAVAGFVNSAEFQNTYGALDNTGFVTLLYQNVLGRAPDAGGLTGWLNALDAGQSRAQVVQGFSQSGEFIAATAPELKTWIRSQGQDDVLDGGTGSNDLWGGAMADVFRFRMEDAGTHRVHDFEAWDYLDFRAFGYTTADDARTHMTQQGANVVFTDQGTTVTLTNTQLASLDNDTFVF